MKQSVLPGTDLAVSRLSFGTASLHHLPSSAARQALLAAALDYGFSHFDTAPSYGLGISEWELGKFLRSRPSGVTVASKAGLYPPGGTPRHGTVSVWLRKGMGKLLPALSAPMVDWSVASAAKSLEQSLRVLHRDCLDVLFLHEPTPGLLDADDFLKWLQQQRSAGKIRYWGLAGPLKRFAGWAQHPLAQVLQIRDGADGAGTVQLRQTGREPQFTYGCLSSVRDEGFSAIDAVKAALKKNPAGSVLVATRKITHLPALVQAAE
jgi:aryl-alcohol dehydrogenase-like predicted oxidoreductase